MHDLLIAVTRPGEVIDRVGQDAAPTREFHGADRGRPGGKERGGVALDDPSLAVTDQG